MNDDTEETPMSQLLQITSPDGAPDPDAVLSARAVMHGELGSNLELLEQQADALEEEEQAVRAAFAVLQARIEARNARVRAYSAAVRHWNRMLSTVSEVRIRMGDSQDEAIAALEYAVPEAEEWTLGDWPEDQWTTSDICNPEGFDLGEVVGGLTDIGG